MHRTELNTFHNEDTKYVCTILAGAPGAGKSTALLNQIVGTSAHYLLAAPRVDLVEEHAARLRDLSAATPGMTPLSIEVVHSRQSKKGSVDRRLRDQLRTTASPHTVVVTTHAALMGLAPEDVVGWHVRVDELPDAAVVSGVVGLAASWPAMARIYDLVPGSEPGWSRVVPRSEVDAPSLSQIIADVGTELVELHRIIASRGRVAEVDVAAWEDAAVPGRRVQWRSIWSLAALTRADSLVVAAAGYAGSLADHAVRRSGGLRVEIRRVGSPRTGQPRIRIRYYTRHEGSTVWWSKPEGSACLVAIGRHLGADTSDRYWMSNKSARPYLEHRFQGDLCSPRTAGTNRLRHHIECAAIYSAKSTPRDRAVADALNLSRDCIRAAREDEDIYQCVTRGAIRDPAYAGDYTIHLYSFAQAERLRNRLIDGGYTDILLVPVPEAGIMDIERPGRTRSRDRPTADIEIAAVRRERKRSKEKARGRRRREEERAARIADGTYRPRGRPRRSA